MWLPACDYEFLLAHLIGQCYSCMYICGSEWIFGDFWKQWSRLLHADWSWRHAGSCGLIPSLLMGLLLALLLLRTYIPSDLSVLESFFLGFDVSFSVLAPCPKEAVFVNIYICSGMEQRWWHATMKLHYIYFDDMVPAAAVSMSRPVDLVYISNVDTTSCWHARTDILTDKSSTSQISDPHDEPLACWLLVVGALSVVDYNWQRKFSPPSYL